jgi:hypothetical protein
MDQHGKAEWRTPFAPSLRMWPAAGFVDTKLSVLRIWMLIMARRIFSRDFKVEAVRLVEESHLTTRRTLEILTIARSSFYRWYDRYQRGGPEALMYRPPRPDRI